MSFYDRIRHRSARSVAKQPATGSLDALQGRSYCVLVSFKRDGTPVPTPVWFGIADDKLYVRTEADSWKVKRIRRNRRVRVAPCTMRGRPLGPPLEGLARVLEPPDDERAERAVAANYGLERRLYLRFLGEAPEDAAFIEIELLESGSAPRREKPPPLDDPEHRATYARAAQTPGQRGKARRRSRISSERRENEGHESDPRRYASGSRAQARRPEGRPANRGARI